MVHATAARLVSKYGDARLYLKKRREGKVHDKAGHAGSLRAYVSLANLSPHRRIFLLVTVLVRAGFTVGIRVGLRRYLRWNRYGKAILDYPAVWPVRKAPPKFDLYVTDKPETKEGKTVHVRYGTEGADSAELQRSLYFPIMQHPNLLKSEMECGQLPDYAGSDRDMLVFFAGNMDQRTYDKSHFQTRYGIANRYALASALLNSGELADAVRHYERYHAFVEDLEAGLLRDKVVLFDASVDRIPQERWLAFLGRSSFFLALPGYTQPFCHNIVEAMMTSSIPLTEYGHLFFPALRHGKECIRFSGASELIERVKEIHDHRYAAMLPEMRSSTRDYYMRHLSLDAAAESILRFLRGKEAETNFIIAGAA